MSNRLTRALSALALLPAVAAAQGPTGKWYLTDVVSNTNLIIQGTNVSTFAQANARESAIAVSGDVRTLSLSNAGEPGSQYTLSGAYTGTSYPYPVPGETFFDGATDGAYNYALGYLGNVWRFDRNWSAASGTLLFNAGGSSGWVGITYDPTNNSLWLSNTFDQSASNVLASGAVYDYALGGTRLSSFYTVQDYGVGAALAMDYSDHTLWMTNYQSGAVVTYQYDRSGNQRQRIIDPSRFAYDPRGGEFDYPSTATPEPATLALLATGLVAIGGVARSRRRTR